MTVRGELHINYVTDRGARSLVVGGLSTEHAKALRDILSESPRVIEVRGRESNERPVPVIHGIAHPVAVAAHRRALDRHPIKVEA